MVEKRIRKLLVLMFVVFLFAFSFQESKNLLEMEILNYKPAPAIPGEKLEVWVRFYNNNEDPIRVKAFFVDEFPFYYKDEEKELYLGAYSYKIEKFVLYVDKDSPSGEQKAKMKVLFLDKNQIGEYYFNINILEKGNVIVKNVHYKKEGNDVNFCFLLSSIGSRAYQVNLSFSSSPPIYILSPTTKYFKSLEEKEVCIPLFVKDYLDGVYYINLRLSYVVNKKEYEKEIKLPIKLEGHPEIKISQILTNPTTIKRGDTSVKLLITLVNTGKDKAKELKTILEKNENIESSKATLENDLGDLNPGERKVVSYYINIKDDANFTIPFSLLVRYKEKDEWKEKRLSFNLFLEEEPVLSLKPLDSVVIAGKDSKVFFYVENKGKKCEKLEILGLKSSIQDLDYTKREYYIGLLNEGEKAQGFLEINPKKDGKINLDLLARCIYSNKVYEKEFRIEVDAKKELPLVWIGGALCLVLCIFLLKKLLIKGK